MSRLQWDANSGIDTPQSLHALELSLEALDAAISRLEAQLALLADLVRAERLP